MQPWPMLSCKLANGSYFPAPRSRSTRRMKSAACRLYAALCNAMFVLRPTPWVLCKQPGVYKRKMQRFSKSSGGGGNTNQVGLFAEIGRPPRSAPTFSDFRRGNFSFWHALGDRGGSGSVWPRDLASCPLVASRRCLCDSVANPAEEKGRQQGFKKEIMGQTTLDGLSVFCSKEVHPASHLHRISPAPHPANL